MMAWRDVTSIGAEIAFTASAEARAVIDTLGRTEDVRFSPSGRRLAVAAFSRDVIAVFDLEIAQSPCGRGIALSNPVEITSPALRRPHGLDFHDDSTLLVANREGSVIVFALPQRPVAVPLIPIFELPAGPGHLLNAPGSVAVVSRSGRGSRVLICNNAAHTVTFHDFDRSAGFQGPGMVLVAKWLDVPDSVTATTDGCWIAISNHNTHSVLVYATGAGLSGASEPHAILRGIEYPHGLRFSADGRHLFVADAGAPYIRVFAREGDAWHGVLDPIAAQRLMSDEVFRQTRSNPREGGPKGLDIAAGGRILVSTAQAQPLLFLDVAAVLAGASQVSAGIRQAFRLRHELARFEEVQSLRVQFERARVRARRAKAKRAAMKQTLSWRLTAPFRWIASHWRNSGHTK